MLFKNNAEDELGVFYAILFTVGETGASCYNFHSKSLFDKNMQARDFFLTLSCNIMSLLSQVRRISTYAM